MRIDLQGVTKRFVADGIFRPALEAVSLTTEFPRILALVGPSGGGKSTLLRLLAGLISPEEGRVLLDGREIPGEERSLRLFRAATGVVFQGYNLFPHLTALRNVMLPLTAVYALGEEEARLRALEVMERLGIADHAGKHPGQLSGGQQQRVAIARALAPKPRFLLFDEPTSALDPEMTAEVLSLIASLKDQGGEQEGVMGGEGASTPMILVTHQMGFARRIADRVAFLSEGRILEEAPAEEFFSAPKTPEATRFLKTVLSF